MNILLRTKDVQNALGISRSTVYERMKDGLLPQPVKTSVRANRWPKDEISKLIAAKIAGVDDEVIRALVTRLLEQRQIVKVEV